MEWGAAVAENGRGTADAASRRPHTPITLGVVLFALLLSTLPETASGQAGRRGRAEPTAVLDARAFGVDTHLEIEPLASRSSTRDALADGLAAIRRAEALVSPDPPTSPGAGPATDGLAELNRQAGVAPVVVDPELFALLQRALDFCGFSAGAFGPLGGHLYRLWGLRQPVGGRPTLAALTQASGSAACDRLSLDPASHTATLAAGSRADLLPLERAFAVDRAIDALRAGGATNGWVQIGHVARAFGGGPGGDGWPIAADATNPVTTPTDRVLLRDRSLALVAAWLDPIEIAGDREAPHLDHRTGRPAEGTIAVLAVTETATDAAGLAAALFVMPQRVGLFRLGALRPPPAVRWYLGTGSGTPLVAERGWAELPKWQPPKSPLER